MHHLQPQAIGQVAGIGALAGARRSLQTYREPSLAAALQTIREVGEIEVGFNERRVKVRRSQALHPLATEYTRQAAHAPAHQVETAGTQVGRRGGAGGDPRRSVEFMGQRPGVGIRGFNVMLRQLTRPDPCPDARRRQAHFQRIDHAPQNGGAPVVDFVGGP